MRRNRRSTKAGCARWSRCIIRNMSVPPTRRPTIGDTTMKTRIRVIPDQTSTPGPALVTPAPAKAPISACEELVGRPQRQVIQSHVKAAARPAKISGRSITSGFTTLFPMVVATATPKPKAATKLKKAAHATAARGVSTRVDTIVAIEFAASWKPFMKSKARATRIRRTRTSIRPQRERSGVFEGHALDHVGDVLTAVDRVLEVVVDLLPLDDVDGIGAVVEEPGDGPAQELVALVLQAVDLRAVGAERLPVAQVAQAAHRVADGLHGLDEHVRERAGLRLDRAELVEPDAFRGGLDQVQHVVHARDQAMHVVAVDRRDEGLMQALDHRVGDLVALVLDGLHALGLLP